MSKYLSFLSIPVVEWPIMFWSFFINFNQSVSFRYRYNTVKSNDTCTCNMTHSEFDSWRIQKKTIFKARKRTVMTAEGVALALSQQAHDTLEIDIWNMPMLFDTIVSSSNFIWLVVNIRTPTTMLLTGI